MRSVHYTKDDARSKLHGAQVADRRTNQPKYAVLGEHVS